MFRKMFGAFVWFPLLLSVLLPPLLLAAPEQLEVLPTQVEDDGFVSEPVSDEAAPVPAAEAALPIADPAANAALAGAVAIGETADDAALRSWEEMLKRTGKVELSAGNVVINVPDGFVYLGPDDAEIILTDFWGNSPTSEKKTLGMLFPQGKTPLDDNAWAVTLDYSDDGYVSDEDADSIDYSSLLDEMKADAVTESEDRLDQGYEAIELVGWAEPPHYDKATHTLYWAKEVAFGDDAEHSLNYNIRVLGRQGVLVMNFVASMHQLPDIRANLQPVLAMASFKDGYRYEQFDPDNDKKSDYSLGGLISGKVLVEVGLIAAALLLLKKFGVLVLLPLWLMARKKLNRNKPESVVPESVTAESVTADSVKPEPMKNSESNS